MSGYRKIPDTFIKELLVRVDLVDLIDSHITLKKSGANFIARCPFHAEKTPSFSVSRSKQFYHCFGCGVSGNAISFLMTFSHLSFIEAVEDLATFVGLPMPQVTGASPLGETDLTVHYDLMAQVAGFFAEQLRASEEGRKAVAYLKERGISGQLAKEFMLGYAPADWRVLTELFDQQALLMTGMLVKKEDGQVYGRFRDRLMFPIRDKRGRVVGFGGRVLHAGVPKYLNSPETRLFHKGQEVYGLYELLQKNAKPKRILLVEGYLDVIALSQAGLGWAVAVLGTAVSQAHIHLLFRFTSELVFCFDGDAAGQDAVWHALDAVFPVLKEGRRVRVMVLPSGHDPDSLVRADGVEQFLGRVESAQALSDYFFQRLMVGDVSLADVEARASLANQASPYLEKIPNGIYKEMMYEKLSGLTRFSGLGGPAVLQVAPTSRERAVERVQRAHAPQSIQSKVLALLVQKPTLVKLVEEKGLDWQGLVFRGADKFKAILGFILDQKPATTALLLEAYRGQPDESIIQKLAQFDFQLDEGIDREFSDALVKLEHLSNKERLDQLWAKQNKEGRLDADELRCFQHLLKQTQKIPNQKDFLP